MASWPPPAPVAFHVLTLLRSKQLAGLAVVAVIVPQTPVDIASLPLASQRIDLAVDIEPFLAGVPLWERRRPGSGAVALGGSQAMGRPLRHEVEDWGSDPTKDGDQRAIADGMKVFYKGAVQCNTGQSRLFS